MLNPKVPNQCAAAGVLPVEMAAQIAIKFFFNSTKVPRPKIFFEFVLIIGDHAIKCY
jgi:hypothetical protein